ncbi:MAG: recombinase family protein [Christensenellaceae bacterium]|jgi:DNA invertase Pin-like site-specific DNA recombinase|nr:recombinase family protein [Christensenellaceae bacterium]
MARKSRKNVGVVDATPVAVVSTVYNAAAYIRLSRDNAKRGDSLETQRDIIENFIAASPDIRLADVYSDNQTTGTRFERPAFQRMMEDAGSGRINCIIVKDLSRFGRNAIDAGYYIEKQLPAMGVRFIAVTDSFDSLEGDGGILLPLKNVIAESYALDISRKCRSVQRQNIRDGRFVGRMAPFGYDKDPEDCRRLIVDEEAAGIVRRIFGWAAEGTGAGEIVRRLNKAGVLPPSHYKREKGLIENMKLVGKTFWQKRTVTGILTDRVYAGDMVQGKTRTVNHKEIAVSPDEWVCVPNTHESVISREDYECVQLLLRRASGKDSEARRAAVPYSPHVFKGKVFCAHRGQPMHRRRQNKDGVYWYRCESQWKFHRDACFVVSVKEAELQEGVFTLLGKYAGAITGGYIRRERMTPVKDAAAEGELKEINARLSQSGRFLKSLYEHMLGSLITAEEFSAMKARYESEIKALSRRADEICTARRDRASGFASYCAFSDAAAGALNGHELTAESIDRLVEKILVRRDKSFEIVLRFRDEFEQEVEKVG